MSLALASGGVTSRDQALAGGLAFATHILFFVILFFSVSWQHRRVDSVSMVELWSELPSASRPAPPPEPAPRLKPEPPPPPPKAVAKPPPKPEASPKPDIALKEKQEKERKRKEAEAEARKQKLIAEKKVRDEAEAKRKTDAEALKKKQAAEAEARRAEKARADAAAAAAAARQGEIDKFMAGIRDKTKRFLIIPPSVKGNPEVVVTVTLLPGGEVLDVKFKSSSGNPSYDNAVERAIRRAQPFSVPAGELFQQFRRFDMAFRPIE
jgi:colicin import membrane protein